MYNIHLQHGNISVIYHPLLRTRLIWRIQFHEHTCIHKWLHPSEVNTLLLIN